MNSKKTLLITWWLGYIGSHTVVAFEKAGYETVIIDNLYNSCLATYRNIWKILGYKPDFYEIDLRNIDEMKKIFEKYKFDWVIHFASLKAVWESCEEPLKYFDNNIIWSIRLFEFMQKYEVKNIIFSSSATVYNWDNVLPYKEEMSVWKTSNPYWTTKFLIEKILEDLAKFSGFNVVNLRYFNPIWAHNSGLIWENPEWIPNNLFPFIMKVINWELDKLKIFWNDYDTIDWTGVRDYIDINDLVDGHLKAWERLQQIQKNENCISKGVGRNCPAKFSLQSIIFKNILKVKKKNRLISQDYFFETFNLWVWKWVSVLELLKVCEKVSGKKIPYEIVERRSWDLWTVYCDPKKAQDVLGWKAKISLEESVKSGIKFYVVLANL